MISRISVHSSSEGAPGGLTSLPLKSSGKGLSLDGSAMPSRSVRASAEGREEAELKRMEWH